MESSTGHAHKDKAHMLPVKAFDSLYPLSFVKCALTIVNASILPGDLLRVHGGAALDGVAVNDEAAVLCLDRARPHPVR
eukprot:1158321-Pelagomonas_calceolata.AAC.3